MSAEWAGDPDIGFAVLVSTAGPLDPPGSGTTFNLTDHAGVNYVRGEPGIQISRGRSDEFQHFQSGTCTLTLKNNGREFDPSLSGTVLNLPGTGPGFVGATVTTPDQPTFAVGDLDVRMHVAMADWSPGGFGVFLVSQWPNVGGNNGWGFGVTAAGNLQLFWTANGTTQLTRTSTVTTGFVDGTYHWVRATLDVNNGAAGHDVRFYTGDGTTWTQLGTTVTTAGTTSIFNSTAALVVSDVLPFAGQVRYAEVRNGIDGLVVATPDFTTHTAGTSSFIDGRANTWTVTGVASIVFDPSLSPSPFAAILKPRRRLTVVVGRISDPTTLTVLFDGYIEGWPQEWTKTTGSVSIVAHDLLSILAQTETSPASGVLIFDDPNFGFWDRYRFAGDLPQEFTGDRIDSLVQMAGLSTQSFSLQPGITQVIGLEPSGEILGLCQQAESAESGFLFVDRGGVLQFYDRHARFQNTRLSTVQATFTDAQYSGMAVDYGLTQMFNDIRFSRPTSGEDDMPVEQIVVDEASIAEFGRRVHSDTIPVISDGETLARAEFWRDRYSTPKQRPSPVVIKPRLNMVGLFLQVARRELLDRIQLVRTPLGIGGAVTFTGLIEQLDHRITKTEWDCTIGISPIDADEANDFLIFDQGNWDEHSFAY